MRRIVSVAPLLAVLVLVSVLVEAVPGETTLVRRSLWQTASYSAIAIAGPSAPPYEMIAPLVLRSHALVPGTIWSTTVIIQNTSDLTAILTLTYRDSSGDLVFSASDDTLPPRGSRSYDQATLDALGESFAGTLVITSTRPLATVVYTHEPTWQGDGLVSFALRPKGSAAPRVGSTDYPVGSTGLPVASTDLYVRRVFNEFFGSTSQLAVANRDDSAADVTVEFFSLAGDLLTTHSDTLAPHGSAVYDSASIVGLPGGLDGSSMAVIRSDQPVVGAVIHLGSSSVTASGTSLTGSPERSFLLPSLAKAYSDYSATSGYGLWNLGTDAATVTVTYYDTTGRGLVADVASIPAAVQRPVFLGIDPSLPDGFIGSAVVTSNRPLLTGVETVLSAPGAGMAYSGVSAPASTLYAPVLRRSATVHTALTVQNASNQVASVRLDYYDQEGTLVAWQSDELPAFTSHVYDQSQMSDLGEDFSGSAVVSADQPMAAVVYEYRHIADDSLTPTPTGSPTPGGTPTVESGERLLLPLVEKSWPPIPTRPVLHDIAIGECNANEYRVTWDAAARAVSYALQEDRDPAFTSPATVYQGSDTSHDLDDKTEGAYYYRVRATNGWGDSPRSETKSVTVGPPMTLWTIVNDTGGDLTIDIHGVARRVFAPGEHEWCVPSGSYTITARGGCGTSTFSVEFKPYGSAVHEFKCGYSQGSGVGWFERFVD